MEKAAAWSIVTGISVPILIFVITKCWDPVADYLGYPFDVRRRVKDLGDAVGRLHEMKDELLRLDPHPSSEQRIGWLQSVQDLQHKKEKIQTGHHGSSLNYFAKCYLGKEAGKELKKADALVTQGKDLLQEARARPHPIRDVQPQHPQDPLWGMASYKTKVLDFIKDKGAESRMLGIWGMGGVGKSSILKLVRDSCSAYDNDSIHHFDHILFVPAGRECTVSKMQMAIATRMGLPMLPDETSQEAIIFNHLSDKSFLLLLDDLWGNVDLEAVGIPMPLGTKPLGTVLVSPQGEVQQHRRRKVVLTTRSLDVCGKMGCPNNTIRMKCLSKEDAWSLFTHKVGDKIVNDARIHPLATKIVEECSGLPMALCTIGQAMSTKKDPKEWRTAIDLLKKSKLQEITDGHEDLFDRLKFSYDNMEYNLKECFLICSLWPEDENIPKEKLIWWWIGLGFIDVSNGTDRGYSIINCLMRQSMLEKGDTGLYSTESSHVKMHDVIRKMALWIVNDRGDQEKWLPLSFCRSALPEEKWRTVEKAWILQTDTSKWSSKICCPQLTMLVNRHAFSLELIHCFQGITFLDLEGTAFEKKKDLEGTRIDKFPLEICKLAKLQHLNLSATEIDELPLKLKELLDLKYLYIRDTGALQKIPQGLILGLKKLQGLDLFCTGAISPKVQYLSTLLDELASPTINLPMLGFTVQTKADITKLGKLDSVRTQALCMHHFEEESHLDIIDLQLLSNLKRLRELAIMNSSEKELVAECDPDNDPNDDQQLLPDLEIFELNNLFKLEKVTWKNSGLYIRVVGIYNCKILRDAIWIQHLQYLEQLTIAYCENMEKLFDSAELPSGVNFPKLKRLYMEELPKLSMISEQPCQFEELSYVCVARCTELKVIQVLQRRNQNLIRIDCNKDWWTSLVQSQEIMTRYFTPVFCF